MKPMSKAKMHHYVPPSYLKPFADSKGFLHIIDRDTQKHRSQPPKEEIKNNYYNRQQSQPQGIDTAAFNRKIFDALKPGGIYLVIDHKAEDGSGWRDAATIHRMGVDTIKRELLAAGFELALESDLLANPADDRTKMVFAPGTRGTTDQAFFIFRKPN